MPEALQIPVKREHFEVLFVSRDDVSRVGFDGMSLTDEQMYKLAAKIQTETMMESFWEELTNAAEALDIPKATGDSLIVWLIHECETSNDWSEALASLIYQAHGWDGDSDQPQEAFPEAKALVETDAERMIAWLLEEKFPEPEMIRAEIGAIIEGWYA